MSEKSVRFYCDICKKTLTIKLSKEFQDKLKKNAHKWPYPLIFPHNKHWAVIFLDENMVERGVTTSKVEFKEEK